MFKVMALLTKRADVEAEWFRDYYENNHVPLIVSLAAPPRVYKRNHVSGAGDGPNVITELTFDSREDYERWVGVMYAPGSGVADDEDKFLDRRATVSFVVDEHPPPGA